MNAAFEFAAQTLETEKSLNRFILNSVIKPSLEKSITRRADSPENKRLLQYYFKGQTACARLLENFAQGVQEESARLLDSRKALAWKQNELNSLAKVLGSIISNISYYGKIDANWEERYVRLIMNSDIDNLLEIARENNMMKYYQERMSAKVDSKKILVEDDWVKDWRETQEKNRQQQEAFSGTLKLNEEEILFVHLMGLYGQTLFLVELFVQQFRNEFHFSMENILKGTPIEIVPPKVKFEDTGLNKELTEILRQYVARKSGKYLKDFFAAKRVSEKIEFLGQKGELLNLFWLLYQNKKASQKPKALAALITDSFTLPNCPEGPDINPDRVREALTRKKAPSLYLPEVRKLAHRKRWIL